MPILITCLTGESFGADPGHFALRLKSSQLLTTICLHFAALYRTLESRISNSLIHVILDPQKPLSTHFGALAGFQALNPEYIGRYLLCHLPNIDRFLESQGHEKEQCYQALLGVCIKYLSSDFFKQQGKYYEDIVNIFGDRLAPCLPQDEEEMLFL